MTYSTAELKASPWLWKELGEVRDLDGVHRTLSECPICYAAVHERFRHLDAAHPEPERKPKRDHTCPCGCGGSLYPPYS